MARRVGLYLRISEDRSNDGLAVDRQREDCRRLAEQRGWVIIEEFVDNDVSAAGKRRRPGFDGLIDAIVNKRIDTVAAVSMDRLSRNRRDDLRIHEACLSRNVLLALVKGSDIDTGTAAGRLVMDLLGSVARHEIEVKSERHRRQIQQAAEQGRPGGGPRPFGFKKGGMELHPVEALVVPEMYGRYLAGAGFGELADWLNREGVKTTHGNRWTGSAVKVVLCSPRYAGIRGIRRIVDEAKGTRERIHTEVAPAQWPSLVTEETFRAALSMIKAAQLPGRHIAYGPTPRFLLSGIALCGRDRQRGGICGLHMISSVGAPGRRTYECTSKRHVSRRADYLDQYIEAAIVRRLQRPDARGLLSPVAPGVDLKALRAEALSKRERLRNLTEDYADNLIDRDQMRAGSARITSQLVEIDARIAAAGEIDVLAPLVHADDYDAAWEIWSGYPMTSRRAAIRRVMRVVVKRGRVGRPPAGAPFDPDSVDIDWL